MRKVSDKICRENQNKHVLCSVAFSENFDITWEKMGRRTVHI